MICKALISLFLMWGSIFRFYVHVLFNLPKSIMTTFPGSISPDRQTMQDTWTKMSFVEWQMGRWEDCAWHDMKWNSMTLTIHVWYLDVLYMKGMGWYGMVYIMRMVFLLFKASTTWGLTLPPPPLWYTSPTSQCNSHHVTPRISFHPTKTVCVFCKCSVIWVSLSWSGKRVLYDLFMFPWLVPLVITYNI